jgi:hypothetical protein
MFIISFVMLITSSDPGERSNSNDADRDSFPEALGTADHDGSMTIEGNESMMKALLVV